MSRIFKSCGVRPNIRYFAEDSNIIASMIECGLGVGIMSELILSRMPYHIVHMPLDPPQYRDIALAVRSNGIHQQSPVFWSMFRIGLPNTHNSKGLCIEIAATNWGFRLFQHSR